MFTNRFTHYAILFGLLVIFVPIWFSGPSIEDWSDEAGNEYLEEQIEEKSQEIPWVREDSVSITGEAGMPILGVRSDVSGSLVSADGDYSMLQLDAEGALRVTCVNCDFPLPVQPEVPSYDRLYFP